MTAPITFDQFLEKYRDICKFHNDIDTKGIAVDLALVSLLNQYQDEIKPLFEHDYERFHKMFRVISVINPGVDSAIWHLMYGSKLIWECLPEPKEYTDEKES